LFLFTSGLIPKLPLARLKGNEKRGHLTFLRFQFDLEGSNGENMNVPAGLAS